MYKSDHDTIVIINGTIEELDIENANINTNLTSKSKVDIYKLLNFLPDAELLKQFKFDEIQLSSIFKNDVLKLNELIINNKNKRFAKTEVYYELRY